MQPLPNLNTVSSNDIQSELELSSSPIDMSGRFIGLVMYSLISIGNVCLIPLNRVLMIAQVTGSTSSAIFSPSDGPAGSNMSFDANSDLFMGPIFMYL